MPGGMFLGHSCNRAWPMKQTLNIVVNLLPDHRPTGDNMLCMILESESTQTRTVKYLYSTVDASTMSWCPT